MAGEIWWLPFFKNLFTDMQMPCHAVQSPSCSDKSNVLQHSCNGGLTKPVPLQKLLRGRDAEIEELQRTQLEQQQNMCRLPEVNILSPLQCFQTAFFASNATFGMPRV